MTIGTRHFTQSARSSSSRVLLLWTIRFTANGAEGPAASSSEIRRSHSSSWPTVRALSDGKAPVTPALHCAITRSGFEMVNSGAPTTGRFTRLSRYYRHCNLRGIPARMVDRIVGGHGFGFVVVIAARVEIAVESGEVAARHFNSEAMPGREIVARGHRLQRNPVDLTGLHPR